MPHPMKHDWSKIDQEQFQRDHAPSDFECAVIAVSQVDATPSQRMQMIEDLLRAVNHGSGS